MFKERADGALSYLEFVTHLTSSNTPNSALLTTVRYRYPYDILSKFTTKMPPSAKAKQGPRVKKEGKGDLYRIGGVDIPYDPELELDNKPKPTPLFPEYKVPTARPLTAKEKDQIAKFRRLRDSIHNGPLYTVLGDNVRVGKSGNKPAASFNPFEGMPKYSQRYTKKRRTIPKLDTRPYGSFNLHALKGVFTKSISTQILSSGTLVYP